MLAMTSIPNFLPVRELPPTFTIQIKQTNSPYDEFEGFQCTISNNAPFDAVLYYTTSNEKVELSHTPDKHTYAFLLWYDSYILIDYRGKTYKLDAKAAEEELRG